MEIANSGEKPIARPPMFALVGPTASGKTSLAIRIASRVERVELVSIDSMTIYRSMDIGTAKPSLDELAGHDYHLVDVADPWEEYSLSRFQSDARKVLDGIWRRRGIALLVGGTGLYYQALADNIEIPGQWPEVRRFLEQEASSEEGVARLYHQLSQLDSVGAGKIQARNARRIVRALEVTIGTGIPFSSHGPGLFTRSERIIDVVGIRPEREALTERIERRLEMQIAAGWLQEVEGLLADQRGLSRTARQALGYRELIDVVEGRKAIEDAKAEILTRTRRFAKRQLAWFRRDERISWLATADEAETALVSILDDIQSKT